MGGRSTPPQITRTTLPSAPAHVGGVEVIPQQPWLQIGSHLQRLHELEGATLTKLQPCSRVTLQVAHSRAIKHRILQLAYNWMAHRLINRNKRNVNLKIRLLSLDRSLILVYNTLKYFQRRQG